MTKVNDAPADAPKLQQWAESVDEYIRARFPILYLVSWEESRCLSQLEQVAIRQRKRFHIWTQTDGLRNPALTGKPAEPRTRDPLIALSEFLGRDKPEILVALDLHNFLDNKAVRRRLRDLSQRLLSSEKTLILLSPSLNLPSDLSKALTVVDVPLPTKADLTECLNAAESRLAKSRRQKPKLTRREREELVRAGQGMTYREFEQSIALAHVKHKRIDSQAIPLVLKEKEQVLRKSSVLEPVAWDAELSLIGGLDQLKSFVNSRREAFSEQARDFGLPQPKGVCLIGVQGCGKSLTAKAVARLYRMPLVRLDMGRLFAGLVGKSEENARTALKLAESMAPCVLWVDELDKGFAGSGSSNLSDGGTTSRVIGTIVTWLQEHTTPVFVVATANDISQLPPELLRKGRFDEIFFVDLPSRIERVEIFKIHLEKRQRPPTDFDLDQLTDMSVGFSGAEIEQAIISGLYDAFNAQRPLTTKDIAVALQDTVPLSVMLKEKIAGLREWARYRARRASASIDLGVEINQNSQD